jgi:hypothetical protein
MIAFRWIDKEKRVCHVRGVGSRQDLFQAGIENIEGYSKYPIDCTTELNFDDLPDTIQARILMLTLAKDGGHIEGVGFTAKNSVGMQYTFVYIYEEE